MGSYKWVVSRGTIVITPIRGLITLLVTTHEPPSRGCLTTLPEAAKAKPQNRLPEDAPACEVPEQSC